MVVIATTAAEQCICLGELWSLLDATRWRGLQQLGSSFQQLLVVASTNIFRWATTRRVPRPWFGSSVGGAPARYFSYAYLPLPTSPGLVTHTTHGAHLNTQGVGLSPYQRYRYSLSCCTQGASAVRYRPPSGTCGAGTDPPSAPPVHGALRCSMAGRTRGVV